MRAGPQRSGPARVVSYIYPTNPFGPQKGLVQGATPQSRSESARLPHLVLFSSLLLLSSISVYASAALRRS
ncbi:unnamed protein product [Peniophora sp. CBMAI 1063]|nr:unnamed protein product [Peniophora sp. CBMAI 1063]